MTTPAFNLHRDVTAPALPVIIGLSGRKYAGKDETCRAIDATVHEVHRIAFGDGVKRELAAACDVSSEFVEQHKSKFRPGLQWWGTEWRRELCRDTYWIDQARTQFLRHLREFNALRGVPVVVFTDCRFGNEAELIKELGGVIWRVERRRTWQQRLKAHFTRGDTHASETALDDWQFDRVIRAADRRELHEAAKFAFAQDHGWKIPKLQWKQ